MERSNNETKSPASVGFRLLADQLFQRGAGVLTTAACAGLWLVFLFNSLGFLPTPDDLVGPDYSLHFPNLLTGYYWFLRNGPTTIPWFSPSQCAGFPFFPDPQVAYFSVPQLLVFLVSPITAVQITFALFSLIGLVGTYWLMRHIFLASRPAAGLAACLFLFNGFYLSRILIGHLTFHPFTLAPLLVAALLPAGSRPYGSSGSVAIRISIAAACLAYMLQAGMVHGIPPVLIAAAVLILVHGLLFGERWAPWLLLAGAGFVALLLSAGKLVSEAALLSSFPRDFYPLPGIPGLVSTISMAVQTLFFSVPADASGVIANSKWTIERHEWDYGVSAVPLLLMAVMLAQAALRALQGKIARPRSGRILAVAGIALLLIIPIFLNWFQPDWNAFLKSLPYFRNSSNLLRFFSAYILIAVVVAGLALDHIRFPASLTALGRPAVAVVMVGLMLFQQLSSNRGFERGDGYLIAPVEAAYARAQAKGEIPDIQTIGVLDDASPNGRNDAMTAGRSQAFCYQPLFGYRLEKFPFRPLRSGQMLRPIGSVLNVKNPVCYLYPVENGCKPGDHFTTAQFDAAKAFLSYRPFGFELPLRQKLADWLSLATLLGLVATCVGVLALRRTGRSDCARRSGSANTSP
jgi:hypothetical protein